MPLTDSSPNLEERWDNLLHEGSWLSRGMLTGASGCYAVGNTLHRWTTRPHRVPVPVISVGNVTLGGSGKTPFVQWLAGQLKVRVAVLSRGYKGEAEKGKEPVIVSRGGGPLVSAKVGGDEPYLLAQTLPGVICIAGRDRVAAAKLACELGAEIILLDDGMQHYRLHRDLEVVVWDGTLPTEYLHLFPRGRLREPLSALERADLIVAYGTDNLETSVPVVEAELTPTTDLQGKQVGLFCGIGRPERFAATVKQAGGTIVHEWHLGDHEPPRGECLEEFALACRARGADCLVCTRKDWVKIQNLAAPLPIEVIDVALSVDSETIFSKFVDPLLV